MFPSFLSLYYMMSFRFQFSRQYRQKIFSKYYYNTKNIKAIGDNNSDLMDRACEGDKTKTDKFMIKSCLFLKNRI